MSVRVNGKVKFYKSDIGYGFIQPDDGSDDVFVHVTSLANSLPSLIQDQRVSFEIVASDRGKGNGKKAANVRLI